MQHELVKQKSHRLYAKCLEVGCRNKKIIARGLCNPCYQKHVRRGTLEQFEATLKRDVHDFHACKTHHPSGVCYSKCGCRCAECKEKRRVERAKQIASQFSSTARFIDGTECRKHLLQQLQKPGVTLSGAAKHSGVPYQTLYNLKHKRSRRIRTEYASMLMTWYSTGWCEQCGKGTRAYGPGRWCLQCLEERHKQNRRQDNAA